MADVDDFYENGKYLRLWSINSTSGQCECVQNAVEVRLLSDEDRAAIEARNEDIRQSIEAADNIEDSDYPDSIISLAFLRNGLGSAEDSALVNERWGIPVPFTLREDLPDLDPPSFFAILEISGYYQTLVSWVENLPTGSIPDQVYKSFAKSRLFNSLIYRRYDPLVLTAQQAIGISDEELNAFWNWMAS